MLIRLNATGIFRLLNELNHYTTGMSKEEIIKGIIQEVLDVDLLQITNGAYLINDLGATESQIAEIVNKIEEKFSIVLGFESYDMTVEDLLIVVYSEMEDVHEKMQAKPRSTHDSFAHQLLPGLAFNEGISLFGDLRFKKGVDYMQSSSALVQINENKQPINGLDYLYDMWNTLSKDLKDNEVYPKGLDYEIVEKSNRLMLLFRFPQPRAVGEAFYSLFVLSLDQPVSKAAKYYTFELHDENQKVIAEWTEKGEHLEHESYRLELTPTQFLEAVLKQRLPRENKSIIDEERDQTVNPQFLVDGLFEKEHIYLKIIVAISHKLKLPVELINRNTPVKNLTKQDLTEIISEVYHMYGIDVRKHLYLIKHDVDNYMKDLLFQGLTCRSVVIRICQHFENRIAGDYDNPKELYLDYRKKIDLISQSPEFAFLYTFISQTYPSFITDNADPVKLENKSMLYKEMLKIPETHLAHNYPIDPRGLFICLTVMAITHANYTRDEVRMKKYLDAAVSLNTKWGPFVKPLYLDKISTRIELKKVRFRKLRKKMDSRLMGTIYKIFHGLSRK